MREMTKPEKIIIHCTATRPGQDVTAEDIRSWHLMRGWDDIGYHFICTLDGDMEGGRPMAFQGAHTKGHNNSIGIAYVGGCDEDGQPCDTLTRKQKGRIIDCVRMLRNLYGPLPVHGHNEFTTLKACPSFDVEEKFGKAWCKQR